MKAIRVNEFGAPEVMRIEEVPDPKPGVGQVVVRLYAAGVNPVDTYIRLGMYAAGPDVPYTPGMDGAGIVEEVGEGVKNFHIGDRVYTARSLSGTYAEKTLCMESQVHPLPAMSLLRRAPGFMSRMVLHTSVYFSKPGPCPEILSLCMGQAEAWALLRYSLQGPRACT